jgi:hypothetical protein
MLARICRHEKRILHEVCYTLIEVLFGFKKPSNEPSSVELAVSSVLNLKAKNNMDS